MILPGHKVAITVARLLTDSKAITKSKDTHYLWKNKVEVTSHNAVLDIVDVQVQFKPAILSSKLGGCLQNEDPELKSQYLSDAERQEKDRDFVLQFTPGQTTKQRPSLKHCEMQVKRHGKDTVFVLWFTLGQTTKQRPSLKRFVRSQERQKGWGTLRFVVYPV